MVLISSDSIKIWSEKDKLERSDFLGVTKPQPTTNFAKTDEDAISVTGIRVYIQQDGCEITIYVIPYINRSQSWLYPYDSIRGILLHEQIHFNITELAARKLRCEISSYQKRGILEISIYAELINTYIKETLPNLQSDFDKKSLNGTIISMQNQFADYINTEFKKYGLFSTDSYEFTNELVAEIFRSD